jgi:hypothetical protein
MTNEKMYFPPSVNKEYMIIHAKAKENIDRLHEDKRYVGHQLACAKDFIPQNYILRYTLDPKVEDTTNIR